MRATPERAGWMVTALGAVGMLLGAVLAARAAPIPAVAGSGSPTQARLVEIQVELSWLADPATYPAQLAAHVVGSTLEVGGLVNDPNMKQKVLQIAQARTGLSIHDKLKVIPGSAVANRPAGNEELCRAATTSLTCVMNGKTEPFQISADGTGQITVSGTVASWEEKLDISRRLSQLPGSTSVLNNLKVARQELAGKPCTHVTTDGKQVLPGDPADHEMKTLPAAPAQPAAAPVAAPPHSTSQLPAWPPDAKPVAPALLSKKATPPAPPAPRVSVYAQAAPGKQSAGSPYQRPEASLPGNHELAHVSTAPASLPAGLPAGAVEAKGASCVIQTEIAAEPKQPVAVAEHSPYKGSVLVHASATIPGQPPATSPYESHKSKDKAGSDGPSPYRGTMFLPEDKDKVAAHEPAVPKESPYVKKAPDSMQGKASAASPYGNGDPSLASATVDSGKRSAYGVTLPTPDGKQAQAKLTAGPSPYGAARFSPSGEQTPAKKTSASTSSSYGLRMVVSSKPETARTPAAPQGELLAHVQATQGLPPLEPVPDMTELTNPAPQITSKPAEKPAPPKPQAPLLAAPSRKQVPADAPKPAEKACRPAPVNRAMPTTAQSWRYANPVKPATAAASRQQQPEPVKQEVAAQQLESVAVKQAVAMEMDLAVPEAPAAKQPVRTRARKKQDSQVVQAVWKQPVARIKPVPAEPTPLEQHWLPPQMKLHLQQSIEAACSGEVKGLEIIPTANYTLKVRLKTSSVQEGQELAHKILNMPELKRYKVDLDVQLGR